MADSTSAGSSGADLPSTLSEHPAFCASAANRAVTPPTTDLDGSNQTPKEPTWNSSSYFAPSSRDFQSEGPRPDSPAQAAHGARTGAEILRRLSLVQPVKPQSLDIDPREVHPGLQLSGGVISATFAVPYSFKHRFGADWVSHIFAR